MKPKYRRVLLKLGGESLSDESGRGIDIKSVGAVADEIIRTVKECRSQMGVVIGGGNIFRGIVGEKGGIERSAGDYMGMLATLINSLALQDALEKRGMFTRVMTAFDVQKVAEPYIRRRAIRHMEKGRVVIFACGTGNPYFSTDTAATLRAAETGAQVVLKATKVDGVYSDDPMKNKKAVRYERLTYMEVLEKRLKVMDSTAISMCMDNEIPIIVFNLKRGGNIRRAIMGEKIGTVVSK
mgnify:CR=1 FL=1